MSRFPECGTVSRLLALFALAALFNAVSATGLRSRHEQSRALRLPGRRGGLRPAGRARPVFGHHRAGHFRNAADLRLHGAAVEARSPDGGSAAADHRRRQDLHVSAQAGYPLCARRRVQGPAARARGRGLHLLAQAPDGSEDTFALDLAARRQDRRPRRGRGEGEADRQVRLRRQDRGTRGSRPLHPAHPAQAARLQPVVRAGPRTDERSRARSRRHVRRRGRTGDGQSRRHRSVQAREMDTFVEDLPRSQPRIPRLRLGFPAGQRPRGRANRRRNERQENASGRPRRSEHHGRGPVAPAWIPERRTGSDEPRRSARAQGARRRNAQA